MATYVWSPSTWPLNNQWINDSLINGIITVNPPVVRPVFILPTRGSIIYTLPTWG